MLRLGCVLLLCVLSFAAQASRPRPEQLERVAQMRVAAETIGPAIERARGRPRQFAVGASVAADAAAGSWDQPGPGIARWRLRFASEGARSLSFRFKTLQLPPDAELWIYGADGRDAQGPYRSADADLRYTPLVRGSEAVIEARMPEADQARFAIAITQTFHGFRDLGAAADKSFTSTNGESSSCNIDVACPQGDAWRNEIRSVALLTINNDTLCSGTLINNTARDDRPLILSANHCGITTANVVNTYAYFNAQRAACNGGAFGTVEDNVRGQALLAASASGSRSDFALFELNSMPPSRFNVHYAGWDTANAAPDSGVGIHHPAGDDKKISVFNSAWSTTRTCIGGSGGDCQDGFLLDAWGLVWSQGITEGGSSGSGLWNQNHRLVGTLSGGIASCIAGLSNGGTDYYARFDKAWSAPSSTGTTLQSVLAPNGSTCLQLDGKDAGSAAPARCDSGGGDVTPPPGDTGDSSSSSGGGAAGPALLLPLLLLAALRRRLT